MSTSGMLDDLLRQLRPGASPESGPRPQQLADRLREQTGVDVALVDGEGRAEVATAGISGEVLADLQPVLVQLLGGELAAAATRAGAMHVRCEVLRREPPRSVLVAAAPSPLTPEAATLASHTGTVLDTLRRVRSADEAADRYRQAADRLRVAVFMALMTGDVTLARRMTVGAVPPLLDAERVRLYLLNCPSAERETIAVQSQDEHGYHGRSMVVRCPVYDPHLICLIPDDGDGGAEADSGLAALLHSLARENPRYCLGISEPQPLHATAEAYEQARHALAGARHTGSRAVPYDGHAPLARLLPRAQAHAWARGLLAPIEELPRITVDVTRLALSFPRLAVARLLGISRNTVTAHLRRVEDALGMDLHDVHDRAVLALALAAAGLPPAGGSAEDTPDAPSLDALLITEEALLWARRFLTPLHDEAHGPLPETLRAWVDAGADARRAAHTLDVSRTTVRARLRTAEGLLNRDLLTPGPGTHDLVHALRITESAS
ncbi:helix-turn-helix domain-containing protein [Streptomonospora litoralis]|uniref:Bacterial regulatory helix-turn-helix protein, lysR family n=1 Tax=Streptomonospora litoralis TaxID=2498135 RepID=A0A4P6Q2Z9_9ACTN|nr:helix-turn-helix domain-containing protein [Streptomonospora litoralis]QBI53621.1 Bacterial regulatory helix-turn-helix protein, lysR family [Streptomonospora litoralis]